MVVAKLLLLVIFTNLFIVTNSAHAYLDPGTGSFIVQSIIATVFAVGMFAKMYWAKLTSIFSKKEVTDDVPNLDTEIK